MEYKPNDRTVVLGGFVVVGELEWFPLKLTLVGSTLTILPTPLVDRYDRSIRGSPTRSDPSWVQMAKTPVSIAILERASVSLIEI